LRFLVHPYECTCFCSSLSLSLSLSLSGFLVRIFLHPPPFLQANERFEGDRVTAFRWDAAREELPTDVLPEGTCHHLFCVFVLSAVHPDLHVTALGRMRQALRPGGTLLFRDYGLYDMRSLRFKPGQMVSPNFFLKGDGTTSYFFDKEHLGRVAEEAGFAVESAQYHCNRLYNKQTKEEMFRVFLNAKLVRRE